MSATSVAVSNASVRAGRSHLRYILVIAVLARIATAIAYLRLNPALRIDNLAYENVSIALSLYHGQGFSSPFFHPSGPTAFMSPGYPLLIAATIKILGTGRGTVLALTGFQILVSLLTIPLVVYVARRYFGVRTGNIAGFIYAICPPMLFAVLYIWDTCISALFISIAMAIAPFFLKSRTRLVLTGLGCAGAGLVNPAVLPAVFAILGWQAWRAKALPWISIFVFLITYSVWPIRNAVTMHAFIPLRTTFGYEMWAGNHPGTDGESTPDMPLGNPTELNRFLAKGELAYMHEKSTEAAAYIRHHKLEFLRVTVKRIARFWMGSSKSSTPLTIPLALAALAGLVLLWRQKALFTLFALPLLLYPLPYYITHPDVRFQFIIDPLLAILAAYACETFLTAMAPREISTAPPQQTDPARRTLAL